MEYYPQTQFERGLLAGVNMAFDAWKRNMGAKGASAGGAPAAQAVPLRPQPYYGLAQPQLAPAHYAHMVFPGFMPQPFTVPTTQHPAQFLSPALVGSGGQRQHLQARGLGVQHTPRSGKSVALVQGQQARGAGGAPRGASSGSHGARMTKTQLGSIKHGGGGGGGTASSGRSGSGKGSGGRSGSGNHARPRHSSVPKPGSSHPTKGATAQAGGKRQRRGAGLQQVAQPDKRQKQGGH